MSTDPANPNRPATARRIKRVAGLPLGEYGNVILVFVPVIALVIGALVPSFVYNHRSAQAVRCSAHLHSIARALIDYADKYSAFPADPRVAIEQAHIPADELKCPVADSPNYLYIQPTGNDAASWDFPMLVEPAASHNGHANVAFIGGDVRYLDQQQYDQLVVPHLHATTQPVPISPQ